MTWQGSVRTWTHADVSFVQEMALAAFYSEPTQSIPPLAEAIQNPAVAAWVQDWGRAGDGAVIAEDGPGSRVGAAMYRVFTQENRSDGFVHPTIPELAIAVRETWRGQGVGTALLHALVAHANAAGIARLYLITHIDSPARRLYARVGFEEFGVLMGADLAGANTA